MGEEGDFSVKGGRGGAGRESGLPCRMRKRGGEEAELHQMK